MNADRTSVDPRPRANASLSRGQRGSVRQLEQDDATGENEQAMGAEGRARSSWGSSRMIIPRRGAAGAGKVDIVATNLAQSD
jgi:hypothetical protein